MYTLIRVLQFASVLIGPKKIIKDYWNFLFISLHLHIPGVHWGLLAQGQLSHLAFAQSLAMLQNDSWTCMHRGKMPTTFEKDNLVSVCCQSSVLSWVVWVFNTCHMKKKSLCSCSSFTLKNEERTYASSSPNRRAHAAQQWGTELLKISLTLLEEIGVVALIPFVQMFKSSCGT